MRVRTPIVCALVAAIACAVAAPAALAGSNDAVKYLRSAQNSDGGFAGGPGQSSSQLMTGWTVLGLEAAGRNPHDLVKSGKTPIDYMRAGAGQLNDAAELSRTVLALRAAGSSVRKFDGRDLLSELERRQRGDGSFQGQAPTTAFAIMALRAADRPVGSGSVRRATGWLAAQQNTDGGFSNGNKGGASDVDDAGAALQGLAAGGRGSSAGAKRAVSFIAKAQNADGGVGQFPDSKSNAQSSAWAAQGLVAVGRNPANAKRSGRSLLGYLSSLQQSDGSYRYSRTSAQTPVWVTGQVLAAVTRKAFPLERVPRRKKKVRATAAATTSQASRTGAERKRSQGTARPAQPAAESTTQPEAEQLGSAAPASATTPLAAGEVGDNGDGGGDSAALWRFGLAGLSVVAAVGAGRWLRRRAQNE